MKIEDYLRIAQSCGGFEFHPDREPGQVNFGLDRTMLMREHALEMFAQEIAKECCKMIDTHVKNNNPYYSILLFNIKKRFGI